MKEEQNLTGDPNAPDSGSGTGTSAPEIPILPPDVVAFGDPEPPDTGGGGNTGDPEPPDTGSGS